MLKYGCTSPKNAPEPKPNQRPYFDNSLDKVVDIFSYNRSNGFEFRC